MSHDRWLDGRRPSQSIMQSRRASRGMTCFHTVSQTIPRTLPATEDVLFKWRLLAEDGRKAGHTFSLPDLLIAATALHHGLTVLSRDTSPYEKARATVFNPWK